MANKKMVSLADFLTAKQRERALEMWYESQDNYAQRVADEIITPNIADINLKLGQKNDPKYLAYCVEYVMRSIIRG